MYISKIDFKLISNSVNKIFSPFVYGIVIAYILNSIVRFFENKIYGEIGFLNLNAKHKRIISITTAYVLFLGALFWIIGYILPEVSSSIQNIVVFFKKIDINYLKNNLGSLIDNSYFIEISDEIANYIMNFIDRTLGTVINNAKYIPDMINTIISGTVGIASYLLNLVLGMVIAFYILQDKEKIGEFVSKIVYAFVEKKSGDEIINLAQYSNDVFEKFFIGKTLDSLIIGLIFFIGCLIIKPDYTIFLSLIIGVTNMIPYFGPFIGAVPVIFLTLLTQPIKAVWLAIFIFVLQQFDGIILGPKILGNSIGVKPIGVIFAILAGGALFGPLGMFFGVPVFSVILSLFKEFIESKYKQKQELSKENKYNE